jgi:hypothetical protein
MKIKADINIQILQIPNRDHEVYMIQTQYTRNGVIFTDTNDGWGYTLEEAQAKVPAKITDQH